MKEKLTLIIEEIVKEMLGTMGISEEVSFTLVIPEKEEHGDFACNAAMQLVRYLKKNPKMIAEEICSSLVEKMNGQVTAEIAGPGFINIKAAKSFFAETVINIINDKKIFP